MYRIKQNTLISIAFNSDGFVTSNVALYSECAHSGFGTCALANSLQCGYSRQHEIIMDKGVRLTKINCSQALIIMSQSSFLFERSINLITVHFHPPCEVHLFHLQPRGVAIIFFFFGQAQKNLDTHFLFFFYLIYLATCTIYYFVIQSFYTSAQYLEQPRCIYK